MCESAVLVDLAGSEPTFRAAVRELCEALRGVAPGARLSFASAYARAAERGERATALAVWLSRYLQGSDVTIVVDSVDRLGDEARLFSEFAEVLAGRGAFAPKLVLAARETSDLPVPRWLAADLIAMPIGEADLRWTVADARAAAEGAGRTVSDHVLQRTLLAANGRAFAVLYALQVGEMPPQRRRPRARAAPRAGSRRPHVRPRNVLDADARRRRARRCGPPAAPAARRPVRPGQADRRLGRRGLPLRRRPAVARRADAAHRPQLAPVRRGAHRESARSRRPRARSARHRAQRAAGRTRAPAAARARPAARGSRRRRRGRRRAGAPARRSRRRGAAAAARDARIAAGPNRHVGGVVPPCDRARAIGIRRRGSRLPTWRARSSAATAPIPSSCSSRTPTTRRSATTSVRRCSRCSPRRTSTAHRTDDARAALERAFACCERADLTTRAHVYTRASYVELHCGDDARARRYATIGASIAEQANLYVIATGAHSVLYNVAYDDGRPVRMLGAPRTPRQLRGAFR